MNIQRRFGMISGLGMSLAMCTVLSVAAQAQQEAKVDGLIIGRDGSNMAVRTADTPRLLVVLSDKTKAEEKGGLFGWSHKDLAITELTPGLSVKIEGKYDPDHKLLADKVTFSRDALKTAKQIDAGLNPVNEQIAAANDQLRSDRKDIENTQNGLEAANQGIAANTQANGQNRQAIGATNNRIGQLDQYETKDTLTINFRNGRSKVSEADKQRLDQFIQSAANTPGYMIQVQGYASKVGNAARNQRLSDERATNVLTIIQQSGQVPLTRILAPAAMGTTDQIGDNHTRSGQAQNRRVVVTLLVNKGISNGDTTTAQVAPQASQGPESQTPQTSQAPDTQTPQ